MSFSETQLQVSEKGNIAALRLLTEDKLHGADLFTSPSPNLTRLPVFSSMAVRAYIIAVIQTSFILCVGCYMDVNQA